MLLFVDAAFSAAGTFAVVSMFMILVLTNLNRFLPEV
jgi:hypothetical protein